MRWYASEEVDTVRALDRDGDLAAAIAPLDGSSSIDAIVAIGTIFGFYPAEDEAEASYPPRPRPPRRGLRDLRSADGARHLKVGEATFSHFSYEANILDELERVFREYGETGRGRTRHYIHDDRDAEKYGAAPGTFSEWAPFEDVSHLLFYEGLHGAVKNGAVNLSDLADLADLKIGVVPVVNLEWIQKIHRDRASRGYTTEAVTDVILRRMHAYVHCICPQAPRAPYPATSS